MKRFSNYLEVSRRLLSAKEMSSIQSAQVVNKGNIKSVVLHLVNNQTREYPLYNEDKVLPGISISPSRITVITLAPFENKFWQNLGWRCDAVFSRRRKGMEAFDCIIIK